MNEHDCKFQDKIIEVCESQARVEAKVEMLCEHIAKYNGAMAKHVEESAPYRETVNNIRGFGKSCQRVFYAIIVPIGLFLIYESLRLWRK